MGLELNNVLLCMILHVDIKILQEQLLMYRSHQLMSNTPSALKICGIGLHKGFIRSVIMRLDGFIARFMTQRFRFPHSFRSVKAITRLVYGWKVLIAFEMPNFCWS